MCVFLGPGGLRKAASLDRLVDYTRGPLSGVQKASNDREGTGGQERGEGTAGNPGLVANRELL